MSFPLRRLPFLATREVIKSMDTRSIFLLSLVSKKSQNFVMSSVPKNSFFVEFAFKRNGFRFELMSAEYIDDHQDILLDGDSYRIQGEALVPRVSSDNLRVQCNFYSFFGTFEVEESIRKIFHFLSSTFQKSEICMKFEDGTREDFAMEMLRFAWGNGFSLDRIDYNLENVSPCWIQLLLNGCQEHTSLYIRTKLPEGFKCTPPPGGYKFKCFAVQYAHWINLDDFLQCRKVNFLIGLPDLTVEYLNGLLKKIVNLECRIESFFFQLKSIKPTDFPEIVKGLSGSAIELQGPWKGLEFERKDGLKLQVSLLGGSLQLDGDYLDLDEDSN